MLAGNTETHGGDAGRGPSGLELVAGLGLEPRQTDPESVVLPLHHPAGSFGFSANEQGAGYEALVREASPFAAPACKTRSRISRKKPGISRDALGHRPQHELVEQRHRERQVPIYNSSRVHFDTNAQFPLGRSRFSLPFALQSLLRSPHVCPPHEARLADHLRGDPLVPSPVNLERAVQPRFARPNRSFVWGSQGV
jgi:hypothetical protein